MDRVDYLRCRISQLRIRGAGRLWAQWLARLELGEQPAGQAAPVYSPARPELQLAPAIARELLDRRRGDQHRGRT